MTSFKLNYTPKFHLYVPSFTYELRPGEYSAANQPQLDLTHYSNVCLEMQAPLAFYGEVLKHQCVFLALAPLQVFSLFLKLFLCLCLSDLSSSFGSLVKQPPPEVLLTPISSSVSQTVLSCFGFLLAFINI